MEMTPCMAITSALYLEVQAQDENGQMRPRSASDVDSVRMFICEGFVCVPHLLALLKHQRQPNSIPRKTSLSYLPPDSA